MNKLRQEIFEMGIIAPHLLFETKTSTFDLLQKILIKLEAYEFKIAALKQWAAIYSKAASQLPEHQHGEAEAKANRWLHETFIAANQ